MKVVCEQIETKAGTRYRYTLIHDDGTREMLRKVATRCYDKAFQYETQLGSTGVRIVWWSFSTNPHASAKQFLKQTYKVAII
jgi:hypothetical protein